MADNKFIHLAQPGVRTLQPYQGGKPVEELERELGIKEAVKLASNENPLGPGPMAVSAVTKALAGISRYPDGNGFRLKHRLAEMLQVEADQITLGNGSNDVLELIARAFAGPGHEIVFSQHAFAVYPIVTQAVGAKAVIVQAKNWGNDLNAVLKAITVATRIVFIANPNNPTGTWLAQSELEEFLTKVPDNVIVVLDEAYFEYASHPAMQATGYPDGVTLLQRFPNLIVTRTFSKAYGLAGLRIGYGIANPEITDVLNRVRQPFNVNSLALTAAELALDDTQHLDKSISLNIAGMQQIVEGCKSMSLSHIPSIGNFVCVEVGQSASSVYNELLKKGIIVRPVANYEMPQHLRITIGTETENQLALAALQAVLKA